MLKFKNFILNLLYPPVCGFCDKICKEHLCKKCEIKIKKYEINSIYIINNKYFNEIFYIFKYKDIIRDYIIKYKFQNKAYLYQVFSEIILKNKKICDNLKKYDIIIPVPIGKKRKRQRGYNQSSLISKEISKNMNLIYEANCLIKQKNTIEQSRLDKNKRKENVQGVYKVLNKGKIVNKNIVLFDDVYTTGNTVNECAKVLKKSGVKSVGVLIFAKD